MRASGPPSIDAAVDDREFDGRIEPADVMHGEVEHQLAVGGILDGGHVELAGGEQVVEEIAALAVFVLVEVDDLVGVEGVGGQRRHENAVLHTVGEIRAVAGGDAAFLRIVAEDGPGHVVLAHHDLLHVVGHGP